MRRLAWGCLTMVVGIVGTLIDGPGGGSPFDDRRRTQLVILYLDRKSAPQRWILWRKLTQGGRFGQAFFGVVGVPCSAEVHGDFMTLTSMLNDESCSVSRDLLRTNKLLVEGADSGLRAEVSRSTSRRILRT